MSFLWGGVAVEHDPERAEAVQRLKALEKRAEQLTNALKAKEEFECPVCLESHNKVDGIKLSACKHRMCKRCARELLKTAIKSCSIPVPCPKCQVEPQTCKKCSQHGKAPASPPVRNQNTWTIQAFVPGLGSSLGSSGAAASGAKAAATGLEWCCSLDPDVPKLLNTVERREYSRRSLQAAVAKGGGLHPCPVPDCAGVAASGGKSSFVTCNACMYCWCLTCERQSHESQTCEQYSAKDRKWQEAEAERCFKKYKSSNIVRQCMNCGHGLEKISGCDHVRCGGCKREWDYSHLVRAT